jgi:superfamily I DNA/RNA helicase
MNTSWWRILNQLSDSQKRFIGLPPEGKHLLEGPPGSGKTNLLLLRAEFMAGSGYPNCLIITYTKTLANFIRSGIGSKQLISTSQIKTYHSWAFEHIFLNLGERPLPPNTDFDEASRKELAKLVAEANEALPSLRVYDAIFVDEAQDLTCEELQLLLQLSDNVCICGDTRQGIYNRNGLEVPAFIALQRHTLTEHFRIGHRIARVADRLLPAAPGSPSLEETSNYIPQLQGESSANLHTCTSRDEQFEQMLEIIRIQLVAFSEDSIGIVCGRRDTRKELRERFNNTDLADLVYVHGVDRNPNFLDRPIHVLTMHGVKGAEFRALHMFGIEELNDNLLRRTKLSYTAVTRAKTSLNAYKTGDTTKALESAFSEPKHFNLNDLFEDAK